jgi:hypothetical protein
MRLQLHAVILALLLASPAAADIVDTKSERQVSLPGANFRIVIPREDWLIMREQTRSETLSVYYALATVPKLLSIR